MARRTRRRALSRYRDIVEIREYKCKVWGALRRDCRAVSTMTCAAATAKNIGSIRFIARVSASPKTGCELHRPDRRIAKARCRRQSQSLKSFNNLAGRIGSPTRPIAPWYRVGLLLFKLIRWSDFDRAANFAALVLRFASSGRGCAVIAPRAPISPPRIRTNPPPRSSKFSPSMWDNLGRLAVEYVNLDRLVDPANPNSGRIVVAPETLETLARLRDDGKPAVLFTSHLASYRGRRHLGRAQRTQSGDFLQPVEFRSAVRATRGDAEKSMGRLVQSGSDAVWRIREAMKAGLHLALFADQHFANGVEVQFFGRPCKANPMAARFAQLFNCPVHGFRAIRLPDNRIQLEFTEELDHAARRRRQNRHRKAPCRRSPRRIESWIREHPEQWLWLQRRWR